MLGCGKVRSFRNVGLQNFGDSLKNCEPWSFHNSGGGKISVLGTKSGSVTGICTLVGQRSTSLMLGPASAVVQCRMWLSTQHVHVCVCYRVELQPLSSAGESPVESCGESPHPSSAPLDPSALPLTHNGTTDGEYFTTLASHPMLVSCCK